MKRKLLFAIVALMCSIGTWATDYTSSLPAQGANWTLASGSGGSYNANVTNTASSDAKGDIVLSTWKVNEVYYDKTDGLTFDAYTEVNVEAGTYLFRLGAWGRKENIWGGDNTKTDGNNIVVYAIGDSEVTTEVTSSTGKYYNVIVTKAAAGTLRVGIKALTGNVANWVCWANPMLFTWTKGAEVTPIIYNSTISCTNRKVVPTGWTVFKNVNGGSNYTTATGDAALEIWTASTDNSFSADIYQALTSLPAGYYSLTASAHKTEDGEAYIYIYSNSVGMDVKNTIAIPKADAHQTISTSPIRVTEGGQINIGLAADNQSKTYAMADNFKLTYHGNPSSGDPLEITSYGYITNPSFESNASGWTNNGMAFQTNTSFTGKAGSKYAEVWQPNGTKGIKQTISDLPIGMYRITAPILARGVTSARFFAAGISKAVTIGETVNTYSIDFYSDGTDVEIGFEAVGTGAGSSWICIDDFKLYSLGSDNSTLPTQLTEIAEYFKANVVDVLPTSPVKTSMTNLYNEKKTASDNASYMSNMRQLSAWKHVISNNQAILASELSNAAQVTADCAYSESTAGAHDTYTAAIAAHATAVAAATAESGITTANNTLNTAIKTYINNVTPATEGSAIEITSLVANPSFTVNTIDGWTKELTNGTTGNAVTSWSCNEFYNNTFDFYQTLAGLPNGSYGLSVQAYSRPGGNETAFADYKAGINNVTAELYVNGDASRVGNIYSYTGNTTAAKVTGNDYKCVVEGGTDYWVPNNMQGASLYFEGGENYKTEVAALVEDGNLRIGFRDATLTTAQWTIFDNFRLFYYGTDKSIYLKQYLPQLETEVADNFLNNGAYSVLKEGQTERAALATANAADADALDTEEDLQAAIDAITTARDNFVAAKAAYDDLNTAITTANSYSSNVGTGVFQITSAAGETLSAAVATAQDVYATGTAGKSDVETAIETLNGGIATASTTLNAPVVSTRYKLSLANKGALTFQTATTDGGYGMPFQAAADYKAQTFFLTQVSGNTYNLSFEDFDGNTRYVCTRADYGEGGTGTAGIRTTTDPSKALSIQIQSTATANVFYMLNTAHNNNKLGAENNGDFYTTSANSNWSISEASQASVDINLTAGKYATRIFPFAPGTIDGIKFYSCENVEGERAQIDEVVTPEANKPYILKATKDVETELSGWGTAVADSYTQGWLTGVYTATTIAASVEPTAEEDGAYRYVLQTQDAVQAFYKVNAEFTATAYRAYLTVPVDKTGTGVKALFLDFGDATGINTVQGSGFKVQDSKIFNLAGQKMSKLLKGVNIVNGKKVLVK